MDLKHRAVILTGATRGIGQATALNLADAGCRLILAARDETALRQLAEIISRRGAEAIIVPTDMGDLAQAARLAQNCVESFGKIDVIINNAGVGLRDTLLNLKADDARRVMDVNYFGPVALIQAAIPYLQQNPEGGLIINISSIVGRRAMPGLAGYCASKAALERMADSLRLELKPHNIRVSTIYPGVTATAFNAASLGGSPLGRGRRSGVSPERVAQTIKRTIRTERRDVFVTLFDRVLVSASMMMPGLMDWLLSQYLRFRDKDDTSPA